MDLNYDIHVRSASFSGCCNTLHCALQITLAEAAAMVCTLGNKGIHACILNRSEDWIDLDSIVTIRYGILYHIVVVFGVIEHGQTVLHLEGGSPAKLQLRGISAQLLVGFTADEFVHGHIQEFTLNVPTGGVDGSHSGGDNNAAAHAPESVAMEMLPDLFSVEGIHADNQLGKILTLAESGLGAVTVGKSCLAETADTLVSVYLNGNIAADNSCAKKTFNACDSHMLCSPCFSIFNSFAHLTTCSLTRYLINAKLRRFCQEGTASLAI